MLLDVTCERDLDSLELWRRRVATERVAAQTIVDTGLGCLLAAACSWLAIGALVGDAVRSTGLAIAVSVVAIIGSIVVSARRTKEHVWLLVISSAAMSFVGVIAPAAQQPAVTALVVMGALAWMRWGPPRRSSIYVALWIAFYAAPQVELGLGALVVLDVLLAAASSYVLKGLIVVMQRTARLRSCQQALIDASDVFAAATTEEEIERAVVAACLRIVDGAEQSTVAYARIDGEAVLIAEAVGNGAEEIRGIECTLEQLVTNVDVDIMIPTLCPDIPTVFGAYLRSDCAVCGVLWIGGLGTISDDVFPILDALATHAVSSTERLRADRRLRSMIESSADILLVIRPDGAIDWVSPALTSITGRIPAAIVDVPLKTFIHPEDTPALLVALQSDVDTVLTLPLRWRHVDGSWRHTESKLCAVAVTGRGRWWTLTSRDVSERLALEVELRHAQKLEAVGRLAAGIAHEINTPVQFVENNLKFLEGSFTQVVGLLQHYRKVIDIYSSQIGLSQHLDGVLEAEREADLDYVTEQVPLAIDDALHGTDRVAHIVRAMKVFGDSDGSEQRRLDINAALESTLLVAHNEIKDVGDVETDFAELPLVTCYPGDINQAFLNVIVNAAHAIADGVAGSRDRGKLTVRTGRDGANVVIEIGDTGTGISEDNASRVFDPFFTTKPVGRGTGQGLYVARAVIERHGGSIDFESVAGEGTTFFIRIPFE